MASICHSFDSRHFDSLLGGVQLFRGDNNSNFSFLTEDKRFSVSPSKIDKVTRVTSRPNCELYAADGHPRLGSQPV
jgi:hypothetical protein